jgi:hypothetical protein
MQTNKIDLSNLEENRYIQEYIEQNVLLFKFNFDNAKEDQSYINYNLCEQFYKNLNNLDILIVATQEIYNLEDNYKRDILNLYLEIILNSCSNQEKIIKNRILLIIDYFEFYNFNLINYKKNLSYHPSIFRKATCKWICCNKDIDGDGCLGGLDPRLNY